MREPNLFIAAIVVCIGLLCAIVASAHEIGKTQAQAVVARRPLPDRRRRRSGRAAGDARGLRAAADLARPAASERDRRIAALGGVFLERVARLVRRRPARVRVRVRARVGLQRSSRRRRRWCGCAARCRRAPPNFAFTYGLALGTYALNVRIGDGPVQTQWVVGGAPSAAGLAGRAAAAADARGSRLAVLRPRLHAHPAARLRSHAVRARHLPADRRSGGRSSRR